MMLSGCATNCPPTMNWYSPFMRKLSPIPPCQPAMPTPPFTASSSPFSCSFVSVPIVQIGTTRLSESINSLSQYASSESFTTTSKSRSTSNPLNSSAPCFGSCPSHPPPTHNPPFFMPAFPHFHPRTASNKLPLQSRPVTNAINGEALSGTRFEHAKPLGNRDRLRCAPRRLRDFPQLRQNAAALRHAKRRAEQHRPA